MSINGVLFVLVLLLRISRRLRDFGKIRPCRLFLCPWPLTFQYWCCISAILHRPWVRLTLGFVSLDNFHSLRYNIKGKLFDHVGGARSE